MAIKVADTFIAVGGDLTGYRKSLGTAKTEAMGLGQQLRQALTNPAGFGGSSKLAGLVADLKLGRNATVAFKDAASGLGTTLKGLSVNALHSGLNGIKNVLGGLKGLASDVFKGFSIGLGIGSFQALGRAISDVVEFIPNLIDRGREYLRTVDDIADATGAGAVETSKFVSTLMFLGVPLNGIINMLGQASRNLELMGPRLEALGIQVHNSNGAWLNQIQILSNARQAMSEWGAGSKKVDILAREFGRGGLKTLVDFLNLTDEQFKRITDDAQKMGLIVTEEQRNLGEAAVREGARFQNVWTGLGTVLFTTVGPSIMAFFSNLTNTIVANMAAIKTAVSGAINFLIGAASSILGLGSSLDSFSGSIENANAVTSPYSSDIIDLTDQITKLGDTTAKATDGTDAQRKSIQKNIDTIDKEIVVLKRQENAQDIVFKRAIAGLSRVYQLRLDALDLAERERANLEQQRDLNDQLNQAQLDLMEAMKGKPGATGFVVDAEDVSKAMASIADIQRRQAENARQIEVDNQKKSLENTRDYIDSIAALLDKADNKRAALNTLHRREDVLEARRTAQLASGDTGGAADTAAKIEAIKTAEKRAQEMIRNGDSETALDKQKKLLQDELSNVKSVAADTTAVKKAELEKQLKALIDHEAKWKKIHDEEIRLTQLLGRAIGTQRAGSTGAGGAGGTEAPSVVEALIAARDAGVKFGKDFKEALGGVSDILGGIVDALGTITRLLGDIGNSDVWKALHTQISTPDIPQGSGPLGGVPSPNEIADSLIKGINNLFGTNIHVSGNAGGGTYKKPPIRAEGGYVQNGLYQLHDREYVIDRSLTAKLERALAGPQMQPAMAGSGWEGVPPHSHDIIIDGKRVAETQMPYVERHLADKRRS